MEGALQKKSDQSLKSRAKSQWQERWFVSAKHCSCRVAFSTRFHESWCIAIVQALRTDGFLTYYKQQNARSVFNEIVSSRPSLLHLLLSSPPGLASTLALRRLCTTSSGGSSLLRTPTNLGRWTWVSLPSCAYGWGTS